MPLIKKCVAVRCNIDQNSNIVLFGIPRPVPESWKKILSVSEINSKTKVCEKHFKKCDIVCIGHNKKRDHKLIVLKNIVSLALCKNKNQSFCAHNKKRIRKKCLNWFF